MPIPAQVTHKQLAIVAETLGLDGLDILNIFIDGPHQTVEVIYVEDGKALTASIPIVAVA